jgi:hypothetical protein
VCCSSSDSPYPLVAFSSNSRCCSSYAEGIHGACFDDRPVCCPGACCPVGSDCSDLTSCHRVSDDATPRYQVIPS